MAHAHFNGIYCALLTISRCFLRQFSLETSRRTNFRASVWILEGGSTPSITNDPSSCSRQRLFHLIHSLTCRSCPNFANKNEPVQSCRPKVRLQNSALQSLPIKSTRVRLACYWPLPSIVIAYACARSKFTNVDFTSSVNSALHGTQRDYLCSIDARAFAIAACYQHCRSQRGVGIRRKIQVNFPIAHARIQSGQRTNTKRLGVEWSDTHFAGIEWNRQSSTGSRLSAVWLS